MIGSPPFPTGPDRLDPPFLSEALGAPVAGFRSTPIGETKGMLGTLVLLDIDYDYDSDSEPGTGPEGPPARLVAKFHAPRAEILAAGLRGRTHERELRFYDELGPLTPTRVPAVHGSWYDPETGEFLLLLEHLDGDDSVDQLDGLTVEQAKAVLTEMARLHATWWQSPLLVETEWLPGIDSAQRRGNLTTLAGVGWPRLVEVLGGPERLAAGERAFGSDMVGHVDRMLAGLGRLPATLVHSDLRVDNIVFDRTGRGVALLDWQGVSSGPPTLDLAYFISQSLPIERRRSRQRALLGHYLDELTAAGGPTDPDRVLAGYDLALIYGLVVATAIPVIADPDEPRAFDLARSMATRAFAALADSGSLDV